MLIISVCCAGGARVHAGHRPLRMQAEPGTFRMHAGPGPGAQAPVILKLTCSIMSFLLFPQTLAQQVGVLT